MAFASSTSRHVSVSGASTVDVASSAERSDSPSSACAVAPPSGESLSAAVAVAPCEKRHDVCDETAFLYLVGGDFGNRSDGTRSLPVARARRETALRTSGSTRAGFAAPSGGDPASLSLTASS